MIIEDFENIIFKDKPDLTTPIIASSLNHIQTEGIMQNREYIKSLDENNELIYILTKTQIDTVFRCSKRVTKEIE